METAEYSKLFVVVFGIGVVFFGLICIILLTTLMGKIVGSMKTAAPAAAPAAAAAAAAAPAPAPVPVLDASPEIIAVITAVLSEDPGISSRGLNITSIKKL